LKSRQIHKKNTLLQSSTTEKRSVECDNSTNEFIRPVRRRVDAYLFSAEKVLADKVLHAIVGASHSHFRMFTAPPSAAALQFHRHSSDKVRDGQGNHIGVSLALPFAELPFTACTI
jgi:hypothetical protein